MPGEADDLLAEIEAGADQGAAASPVPEAARMHLATELHRLRAARHGVIADMATPLA